MKHTLAILATAMAALSCQPANAQIDQSPGNWGRFPELSKAIAEARAKAAAIPGSPTLPAHIMLPPPKYDGPYRGGQLIVTKWNDYSLIRLICKNTENPIACSYKTYETVSGKLISCLVMLGPIAHDNALVLRHEIGHCNGWTDKHEDAR